jgi:transposase InsO family protein
MVAQEYPVTQVCEVLAYARSSYYHRAVVTDEEALQQAIEAEATQWPTYGYRRITHQLRRQGWTVNHKRVERIMNFPWFRGVGKDVRYTTPRKWVNKDEESTTNLHSRV